MTYRPALVGVAVAVALAMLLATVTISADTGVWKLVLIAIAVGLPGALSATRHPRNAAGWLLLSVGLVFASLSLASQWIEAGNESDWASWIAERAGAIVVPLTVLALFLLPDGRLPSRRWRPVAVSVIAVQVGVIVVWSLVEGTPATPNPVGILPSQWAGPVNGIGDWLLQVPLLLVVAAVAVRFRRQSDRAQLAGLFWGAAGFAFLTVAGRVLWPPAADVLDVIGAVLLGSGISATLLQAPETVDLDRPTSVEIPELSPREREVLELLAEGLTNKEIAERLFISPVTARNHVSRILTKLGLENRTQAATWFSRRRAGHSPGSMAS